MLCTWNELERLFGRLWLKINPHRGQADFDYMWKNTGATILADKIARDLWVLEIPEDEDTKEFRRQMLHLHYKGGCWDLVKPL